MVIPVQGADQRRASPATLSFPRKPFPMLQELVLWLYSKNRYDMQKQNNKNKKIKKKTWWWWSWRRKRRSVLFERRKQHPLTSIHSPMTDNYALSDSFLILPWYSKWKSHFHSWKTTWHEDALVSYSMQLKRGDDDDVFLHESFVKFSDSDLQFPALVSDKTEFRHVAVQVLLVIKVAKLSC